MRRLLVPAVASVALAACQRPQAPAAGQDELRRTLQDLNDRLVDAYQREDVPLLRSLLSDRHIHNNVFGSRMTKDEFLADIESGTLVFESYETPEIEWFLDDELAVATGVIEASAIRAGRQVPASTFRFTRVFVREDGGWKVLLFQNTMVPERDETR